MATENVNKNLLDVSQVFQTYVAFAGDTAKTAVACQLDEVTVQNLEKIENWKAKIREWEKLREGDSRDVQIQINRGINFVQAARARSLLDKVIQFLSEGGAEDLVERLTVNTKHGPEFKTRALTDLVKAMEACQLMTQRALGDTAEERPASEDNRPGSSIALQVMNALNAAERDAGLDSVAVVRKSLAVTAPPPPDAPAT